MSLSPYQYGILVRCGDWTVGKNIFGGLRNINYAALYRLVDYGLIDRRKSEEVRDGAGRPAYEWRVTKLGERALAGEDVVLRPLRKKRDPNGREIMLAFRRAVRADTVRDIVKLWPINVRPGTYAGWARLLRVSEPIAKEACLDAGVVSSRSYR